MMNHNEPLDEMEQREDVTHDEMKETEDISGLQDTDDKKEKHSRSKNKKEERTEKLESELAVANDKFLRLYSEFDNYRKRTLKEKSELSKTASADVLLAILPVLDDFERALKAFEIQDDSTDGLKHGIILIYKKFMTILSQQGLQQMKTVGEPFDTDFHEAITNIPASSPDQKGKVVDEIEKGYLLNGKVIRFAKVVVAN